MARSFANDRIGNPDHPNLAWIAIQRVLAWRSLRRVEAL